MARSRTQQAPASDGWADPKWDGPNLHNVVMPSGRKATVRYCDLGALVLANAVPDDYLELAQAELTHELGVIGAFTESVTGLDVSKPKDLKKAREITSTLNDLLKWLVAEHVLVEPKLTPEELSGSNFETDDLDWLFGVATRRVSEDARGRRLGVARLDEFATFPDTHGCPPDCPHCLEAIERHSTARLGAL
jgi:hypothetical protein